MDGTVGIGNVTAESSLSFSDILDNLEFGFMGTYRASKDRYSITFDAIYMGLGVTQKGRNGLLKGDIDLDQIGLAADFGYALSERFTLLAGLRYTDLDTQIKASGPLGNTLSGEEQQSWVDPVIGAKVSWPLPSSGRPRCAATSAASESDRSSPCRASRRCVGRCRRAQACCWPTATSKWTTKMAAAMTSSCTT